MRALLFSLYLLGSVALVQAADGSALSDQWRFQVSLDDKVIGSQVFELQQEGSTTRLRTEADLKVRFLMATVYRYSHQNLEIWEDGCLVSIDSSTDANRKSFSVRGERRDGYFAVDSAGEVNRLPECIMSFAYWNPGFLQQGRLLSSQDGAYLSVDVSEPVADQRRVRGESVAARRYRLTAENMELLLWYSPEGRWLGLESKTRGGRTLRYDLL